MASSAPPVVVRRQQAADEGQPGQRQTLLCIQLKSMLWKNRLMVRRNPTMLFREIGIPLLLLLVLVSIRSGFQDQVVPKELNYKPIWRWPPLSAPQPQADDDLAALPPMQAVADPHTFGLGTRHHDISNKAVYVTPCSSVNASSASPQDRVAAALGEFWQPPESLGVRCFECEVSGCARPMMAAVKEDQDAVLAALAIDELALPGLAAPPKAQYRMRMDGDEWASSAGAYPAQLPDAGEQPEQAGTMLYDVVIPLQVAFEKAMAKVMGDAVAAAPAAAQRAATPAAASAGTPLPYAFFMVQQPPSEPYTIDDATQAVQGVLPIYMTLIFTVQVRVLLQQILEEKENKLKENLTIMGLGGAAYWLGWLIMAFVKLTVVIILCVFVMHVGNLFHNSNPIIIFLFYATFALTCVAFVACMSTFFSHARTGGVVGFLIYLAASTPSYALGPSVARAAKIPAMIIAPTAFNLGNMVINLAEANGKGVQWSNIADPNITNYNLAVTDVIFMLLIDAAFYAVVAWWLDKVVPNEYGTTLPVCFPCMPSYWEGRRRGRERQAAERERHAEAYQGTRRRSLDNPLLAGTAAAGGEAAGTGGRPVPPVEPVAADVAQRQSIHVAGLTKVFPAANSATSAGGRQRRCKWCSLSMPSDEDGEAAAAAGRAAGDVVAVDTLQFEAYAGQITTLLGHNGAGKTTLTHMLTGLFGPTAGDATVCGRSIVGDMAGVREIIGVCPQHDVLYAWLTVREHLLLFAGIKGMTGAEAEEAAARAISEVGLDDKADALSSQLSGGQKRRLSVAISFMGNPKAVLCDEPTSGLDPQSRRHVWGLLMQKRAAGCVVILTTHFLDEADVLSDRVAVLSRGRLQVCGSPLFLKGQFGLGYQLTVSYPQEDSHSDDDEDEAAEGADVAAVMAGRVETLQRRRDAVMDIVRSHVQHATLVSEFADQSSGSGTTRTLASSHLSAEVAVSLPREQSDSFAPMLDELAQKADDLGHKGFSMSMTTLEQAFLQLATREEAEERREAEAEEERQAAADDSFAGLGAILSTSTTQLDVETPAIGLTGSGRSAPQERSSLLPAGSASRTPASEVTKLGDFSVLEHVVFSPWRQVQAVLWRRSQQSRRDTRGFVLQCLMPVLFVFITSAFNSLSELDVQSTLETFSLSSSATWVAPGQVAPTVRMTLGFAGVPALWQDDDEDGASDPGTAAAPGAAAWVGAASYPYDPSSPASLSDYLGQVLLNQSSGGLGVWPAAVGGEPRPTPLDSGATDLEGALEAIYEQKYVAGSVLMGPLTSPPPPSQAEAGLTLVFNTSLPGSIPPLLSAIHSAMVGQFVANHSSSAVRPGAGDLVFNGTFDPFPRSVTGRTGIDSAADVIGTYLQAMLSGLFLAMGYAVIPALQAVNIVKEKENQARQLQLILGLQPAAYWAANWLYELAFFVVPWIGGQLVLLMLGTISASQLPALAVLLLAYGIAAPGPAYCLSFLFNEHPSAQTWTLFFQVLTTVVLFMATFLFGYPGSGIASGWAHGTKYLCVLFPAYGLAQGFADVVQFQSCDLQRAVGLIGPTVPCHDPSAFEWNLAGMKVCLMVLSVPVYFCGIMLLEQVTNPTRRAGDARDKEDAIDDAEEDEGADYQGGPAKGPLRRRASSVAAVLGGFTLAQEDEDVSRERLRVHSRAAQRDPVRVVGLRRVFYPGESRQKVAVRNLNLGVRRGEIFGLLGPNGAGKSTTLSMMTGGLGPSKGNVLIENTDIADDTAEAYKSMGFCPQFDALFELCTGREVISFYLAIKGIPVNMIDRLAETALAACDLTRYADRLTRGYSGGNKRKLSLAIAYVTSPRVVLLDEPSTGVDPLARRKLWDVILGSRDNRATIITTHVMEECDALASRIGILVKGRLACLGSPEHLKARFAQGYTVEVKAGSAQAVSAVTTALRQLCEGDPATGEAGAGLVLVLDEAHGRHAKYTIAVPAEELGTPALASIPGTPARGPGAAAAGTATGGTPLVPGQRVPVAELFRLLEEGKETLGVIDYGVTQTSLESVFLRFARLQDAADGAAPAPGMVAQPA